MTIEAYESFRDDDFTQLRRFLRRISERLDALEGRTGPVKKYDSIDMGGNKITSGPSIQATASDSDFITKQYLSGIEAANLIQAHLKAGGTAPLNVTNLPGSASFGVSAARVDLFSQRGSATTHNNEWFFASDRNYVSWISNGANWVYTSGIQYGVLSARPTATLTTNDTGYLYRTTDTHELFYWTGSAWAYAPLAIDTPTFVVDPANHRVGMGIASPSQKLEVYGGNLYVNNTAGWVLVNGDAGFSWDNTQTYIKGKAVGTTADYLSFATRGVSPGERMRIDSVGNVTVPVMSSAGFVKNSAAGLLSGGGSIAVADLPTMTSADLAGKVSDETGSGKLVFDTAPVFSTSITADSPTLVVDSTNHRVGMGTVSPAVDVEILRNRTGGGDAYVTKLRLTSYSTTGFCEIISDSNSQEDFICNNSSSNIAANYYWKFNNVTKLSLNGTGHLSLVQMTTTVRDSVTPVNGMLIYNSTTNKFQGYQNSNWVDLA